MLFSWNVGLQSSFSWQTSNIAEMTIVGEHARLISRVAAEYLLEGSIGKFFRLRQYVSLYVNFNLRQQQ